MEIVLENLKKIREYVAVISIIIAAVITVFNWFSNLDNRLKKIENDLMKLKIENRIMYRNSLIRNKVRIEREIKELMEREPKLSQIERERLTELIVEKEKIMIELKSLSNISSNKEVIE